MSKKPVKAAAAADAPAYLFTEQIGHQLRRAYQRHVAIFQRAIPDSQLTAAQFVTLCSVRGMVSCSLKEIVAQTAIDQATIRGVVERLTVRGLLQVASDPSDGRKLSITLTEAGQTLVEEILPFARDITEATYGTLNPGERVALIYLLEKMCSAN